MLKRLGLQRKSWKWFEFLPLPPSQAWPTPGPAQHPLGPKPTLGTPPELRVPAVARDCVWIRGGPGLGEEQLSLPLRPAGPPRLWVDIAFTYIGASISTHKQSACEEEAWTGFGQDTQVILPIEPPSATSSTSHSKEKTLRPRLSCERWKGGHTGTRGKTVLVTFDSVISPLGKLS